MFMVVNKRLEINRVRLVERYFSIYPCLDGPLANRLSVFSFVLRPN